MKVLCIDPGERVGWCRGTLTKRAIKVDGHGISFLKDFAIKLAESISSYDVVVYEKYRIAPGMLKVHAGSDVPTLQLVGMIRLLAWLNGTKLVGQTPSNKNTAHEKLIPAHYAGLGILIDSLPKAHDDSHDGDAIAHLAYYHYREYR